MARKEKSTLDFIQMDCLDKTTFKRLNRKYGKEGRLFLIDLLRLLARTEWYYLDLSDQDILEDIMIDELDIKTELGLEILDQLAKWGMICGKTWSEGRGIWCQKLIDRHIEVFNKRKKIPENPFFKSISAAETPISASETPISAAEMQQSKVKESKVKEIKENNPHVCTDKNTIFTEEQFLKRWADARTYYDKKPTNIKKLVSFEKVDFAELKKDYSAKEFDKAIQGLFQQETFPSTRLRPSHFLKREYFETYLTCAETKEKLFENKNKFKKAIERI